MVPRKNFRSESVSSQVWCDLILVGWMGGPEKQNVQSELVSSKSGLIACGQLGAEKIVSSQI